MGGTPGYRRVVPVERVLLPILAGIVLLIAVLFYRDADSLRNARLNAERLQQLVQANEVVLSSLKDLETGQRGFLLTGDPAYRVPYDRAKQGLPGQIDALRSFVRKPDQTRRADNLRTLIASKTAEVDATLLVRDQLGDEAALAIVRSGRGQAEMDAIRAVGDEIRKVALSDLVATSEDLDTRTSRTRTAILLGGAALVILLLVALVIIQRSTRRREELAAGLEAARRQFEVTLSSIGDGVVTTDSNGTITFLNPVACKLTGWAQKDAVGAPIASVFQIVHGASEELVPNPVTEVLTGRRPAVMANDANLKRPDGSHIPIDDSAAPILDASNRLTGVVMVFRDISSRRGAELALKKWEHVFVHARFGMFVVRGGDQLLLEQVNPAFAAMHGYSTEELVGQPYTNLVAAEMRPAKVRMFHAPEDHQVAETTHVRKDGSTFPALTDFTRVRDPEQSILYYTGYCSDISERRAADDALRQSEQRFRDTADSLPQLIWTSQPDGTTEYLNSRWYEETGMEASGVEWLQSVAPEDLAGCSAQWNHSLESGETFHFPCRLKVRGGGTRWYTCRAVPVRDSAGRVIRWFGSCTDTHEQKLAQDALRASKEQLQIANEALKRSNQDLEQFAYAVSHDLQEPLRMVAIYSNLLKDELGNKLDGQLRAFLDFAVDGALRMEAQLKDLLAYSRAAGPDDPAENEHVNGGDALNKAMANLRAAIEETGAEIAWGELPQVKIPEVHLVQIFQNLVANALKYRRPAMKPVIRVESHTDDGVCKFSVRDNGIGIDPQYHERVFRVFRRLHGSEVPGTGIGLALCKRLVERNDGSIWVESSKPGEGTTFSFTVRL